MPVSFDTKTTSAPSPSGTSRLCIPAYHLAHLGTASPLRLDLFLRPVVAYATYTTRPALRRAPSRAPILHLPLSFPTASSTPLTTWATISLHLPTLLQHFTSPFLSTTDDDNNDDDYDYDAPAAELLALPSGRFSHTSHVKVYATCRLRRIWFSQTPLAHGRDGPWELQLFADA